ncbi:hypothetical protein OG203_15935 [Nocardia sp. NBC_01499]|uniref:tyrosine-type recombinase/integrase n=1 Tax=Nocardia sp. NBC_01499 TaxID=2903597 RepID=UPI00386E319B
MTSCVECLAWGLTYAQGVCTACYNFSADGRHPVGDCGACHRRMPLKDDYCRLCWCQAVEDRAVTADNPRDKAVLAPYLPQVRYHQLFLADLYHRHKPPHIPARRGAKGPRLEPAAFASRLRPDGVQLIMFTDLLRTYRYGTIDLRSVAPPNNSWLSWALHLSEAMSETHGFSPATRRALNRNLVMLLANHVDGDTVRVSEFHDVLRGRKAGLVHVIDVLSRMGVLVDDRPNVFDTWLETKLADLAPGIAAQVERWAHLLRHGGPRRPPRRPHTALGYVYGVRPALLEWSSRYQHLREVTRDDVLAHLDTVRGNQRHLIMVTLRSLFGWAKRDGVIFRNPCARIRITKPPPPIWQRLSREEIAAVLEAATTPHAKLCIVLAAVHAARRGHIQALRLDDVDLGNRRISIDGRTRPLDELTHQVLIEWLDHRRRRWPNTANPYVLINKSTALRTVAVSPNFFRRLGVVPAKLERLRIDRQLDEAITCGGDPLHMAAVFGLAEPTAIRYATNAQQLLAHDHATARPGSLPTQVPTPQNEVDPHLGSTRKHLGSNELR